MGQFFEYLGTLLNLWFGLVGGAFTLNEIAQKFFGRSWELPTKHRVVASLIVLAAAQYGAYTNLQKQVTVDAGGSAAVQAEARGLKSEVERLRNRLDERDDRIGELQTLLTQKAPIVVPAPAVNVFQGSGSPPPVFSLTTDSPNVFWGPTGFQDWNRTKGAIEVTLPWDDMVALDAYADLTLFTIVDSSAWGQARIWDLTNNVAAVETPRVASTGQSGKPFHLWLPRQTGTHRYVLQLRIEQRNDGLLNATGQITLTRR